MNNLNINICIVQISGNTHALGFLDQARYFQHQFRRLGYEATIEINRIRGECVNFIFGAHAGFDTELARHYRCVIVNLEQLGREGATVSGSYIQLLKTSVVVDYDQSNVSAYRSSSETPIITFGYAPYLRSSYSTEIDCRPIDILFVGSMNERRHRILREIQLAGVSVSVLKVGIYGEVRDKEIMRSKAVFNCHFYESARFEQARVFQCLSLGTAVISERSSNTKPPSIFEDSVFWTSIENVRTFFEREFGTDEFFDTARSHLYNFGTHDVGEQYRSAIEYIKEVYAL
ncbi:hypothetical protein C7401_106153 [Paraburkholderia unamae]|uniref:hypothetical protein n=1 Tax=Paraburkholderia unamae TaxID=219649 RepID=UPI000DC3C78F|nr:hypothetical protein [Paraburkholderia unamae]RAR62477.1 hypothetical protein C7401_106153 [Paraburkholderia unamae]